MCFSPQYGIGNPVPSSDAITSISLNNDNESDNESHAYITESVEERLGHPLETQILDANYEVLLIHVKTWRDLTVTNCLLDQ